ncbi:MAG TPA: glutaminyl-peptide cyclotransferase [Flavipsychrobacter sp.]|nr:glutaminyl-peptide cyclotransferase [Flavipsychrobacter sp.]
MRRLIFISFLLLLAACNNQNKPASANEENTQPTISVPAVISYHIVNEYPHDTAAFTEGLQYLNGNLYESTGQYGASELRKTDLKTGKILQIKKLDAKYFGEGLTVLSGKIYQLTYREGIGFVYDLNTFKQEGTFAFNTQEGWGMTNDGTDLIFDDGTNVLHYIDPNTFKEVKRVNVTDEHGPVNNINELEYIKGLIYANVWEQDILLKIDPATGNVVGRADMSDLRQKAGIAARSNNPAAPEAMNGIAYDSLNDRLFITGKYWPKVFEMELQ